MIQTIWALMLSTSLTFMMMNHPLSMGLTLLIQVTLVSMITGLMTQSFWFSYILFMIMVGGMLVLFIYMTSVASNEKFVFSFKPIILTLLLTMMFSITTLDSFMNYIKYLNMDTLFYTNESTMSLHLNKYLNLPTNMIMLMLIIYLLITLIAVVKITNIQYGPLRQKH